MEDVPMFPDDWDVCERPDYHATITIQLCELANAGFFDLSRSDWAFPKYNDEQNARLCEKITTHYWYREISLTPPGIWKREFLRKVAEIMPKYISLYKVLDESPQLLGAESEYYKGRNIYSDFPQTQLNGSNGDYASTGNDTEYERIRQLDILEFAERLRSYDDVDLMIINDMESLFTCMFTVNVNAF